MARGSALIGSRITKPKPDVARNSNALNNERSFVLVKKHFGRHVAVILFVFF